MSSPQAWPGRVDVADNVASTGGLGVFPRKIAFSVAEAMFMTDQGPPPADRLNWVCNDLDHFFRFAGTRARLIFLACLTAISTLAPWMIGRVGPFWRLSLEDRVRALTALEESPLGLSVFGAKAPLCFIYYEHPDAARAIGHDDACLTTIRTRAQRTQSESNG